ncbi:hypothetical protein XPA_010289 [Xanthoria parietina]
MAIKPIVGKFRRGIVLDLSVAFGTLLFLDFPLRKHKRPTETSDTSKTAPWL